MDYVNSKRLNSSTGVPITNLAIANGATLLSEVLKVDKNVGFLVILAVENKVGAGGSISIFASYSDDGVTFYRTYTTDLAGTIAQEGNIVTALSNVTRRIVHTARLAKFVQYSFVAAADSQV